MQGRRLHRTAVIASVVCAGTLAVWARFTANGSGSAVSSTSAQTATSELRRGDLSVTIDATGSVVASGARSIVVRRDSSATAEAATTVSTPAAGAGLLSSTGSIPGTSDLVARGTATVQFLVTNPGTRDSTTTTTAPPESTTTTTTLPDTSTSTTPTTPPTTTPPNTTSPNTTPPTTTPGGPGGTPPSTAPGGTPTSTPGGGGAPAGGAPAGGAPTGGSAGAATGGAATGGAGATGSTGPTTVTVTITGLPGTGVTVNQGERLYSADGSPTTLLYGDAPAHRTLASGVDDGADITEMETALKALGYDPGTVDAHWSSSTTDAVKAWETATGQSIDGQVQLGQVEFAPGQVTVVAQAATVGNQVTAGTTVLEVTSKTPSVQAEVADTNASPLKVGDAATITLANADTVPATIAAIGRDIATTDGDLSTATRTVTLAPTEHAERLVVGAAVTATVTTASVTGAVLAPVSALADGTDGRPAVTVVDGTARRSVPVTIGLAADGSVAVTGNGLDAGTTVAVP